MNGDFHKNHQDNFDGMIGVLIYVELCFSGNVRLCRKCRRCFWFFDGIIFDEQQLYFSAGKDLAGQLCGIENLVPANAWADRDASSCFGREQFSRAMTLMGDFYRACGALAIEWRPRGAAVKRREQEDIGVG